LSKLLRDALADIYVKNFQSFVKCLPFGLTAILLARLVILVQKQ